MKNSSHSTQQSLQSVQTNSSNQTINVGEIVLGCGGIVLFICLVLGAVIHKRRRVDHASDLRRQIELLERIWRLPSKPLDK
jgi:beta-lactamase regulating signal transducer with metallopeptidase domain